MNKNNLVKIVVVLIALAGVMLLGWLTLVGGKSKTPKIAQNIIQKEENKQLKNAISPETANIPQVVETSEKKISEKLSQEIPHYEQTEKIQAHTLKYPNSTQTQDVYWFYSAKSMDENLAYYTDWAKKNEWTVVNTVKEKDVFSLYLTKAEETLVMKTTKDNNKVRVSLDLLKN